MSRKSRFEREIEELQAGRKKRARAQHQAELVALEGPLPDAEEEPVKDPIRLALQQQAMERAAAAQVEEEEEEEPEEDDDQDEEDDDKDEDEDNQDSLSGQRKRKKKKRGRPKGSGTFCSGKSWVYHPSIKL